jgi:hypothetical protein
VEARVYSINHRLGLLAVEWVLAEDALHPLRPGFLNLPYEPSFQNGLQTPPTICDQQNENLATNHLVDDPVGFEVDLSTGLDTQRTQFGEKISSLRMLLEPRANRQQSFEHVIAAFDRITLGDVVN